MSDNISCMHCTSEIRERAQLTCFAPQTTMIYSESGYC